MPCGQSFWLFQGISKSVEFVIKEVFDGDEDEAKAAGKIVGGVAAFGMAIATFDAAGATATAADIANDCCC